METMGGAQTCTVDWRTSAPHRQSTKKGQRNTSGKPGKDMAYPEVDDTPHHVTVACESLSVMEEMPWIPPLWHGRSIRDMCQQKAQECFLISA
jgi:hypothetical protein